MLNDQPKISIITVAYNSADTIGDTLKSVARQTYPHIEHIIIDGKSTDRTMEIVQEFPHVAMSLSEIDNGIYDAMNKGIRIATGDYVVVLNSDDFYHRETILEEVATVIKQNPVDCILGNVVFVKPDAADKVVRNYSVKNWHPGLFKWGFMPAHPATFIKKSCYEKYGLYRTDYRICADYELLVRMLYSQKSSYYIWDRTVLKMRAGGISNASLKNRIILNQEIVRACREHGIKTNLLIQGLKVFTKMNQFIFKGNIQL